MTRADELLGSAPPRTLDSVLSGLVRLRRNYDMDDEERQAFGTGTYPHPDITRVRLIDSLMEWIRPEVDRAAREAAEDRTDAIAKQRAIERALDGWD